jgi:PadR family transcriptional regulator PadR
MASWIPQLRKGLVDYCILLALRGQEHYGYSLVQRLSGVPQLAFTESTVYPALARLINEGLVRATPRPSPRGPARRYLSLTAGGKARLLEMDAHWREVYQSVELLRERNSEGNSDEP